LSTDLSPTCGTRCGRDRLDYHQVIHRIPSLNDPTHNREALEESVATDTITSAWALALETVPTKELGPAATSMLRSARPLGDIEGTILLF